MATRKRAGNPEAEQIAAALATFNAEASDLLNQVEDLLETLAAAPQDRETLNALFRCAHTIKGSAGLFGLDAIVSFTHHVETLLDELRAGRVAFDAALSGLLLRSFDHTRMLLDASRGQGEAPDGAALVAELVARAKAGRPVPAPDNAEPAQGVAAPAAPATGGPWHLSVRFGESVYRSGSDPLLILRYLREGGGVPWIELLEQAVGPLESQDPESCALGAELLIEGVDAPRRIDEAFEFVSDCVALRLLPPERTAADLEYLRRDLADDSACAERIIAASLAHRPPPPSRGEAEDGAPRRALARADDFHAIKVRADRLDQLINLVGEMAIVGSTAQALARASGSGHLLEINQQLGRLLEEVRNSALQLRMVQIGDTFYRFRRVVREIGAELGKDVEVALSGTETELDKTVIERIGDPLMHLVRNALDHGLETPPERRAAGKPEKGRLSLSARHESGAIVIEVADDGRGLRRDKVLARAIERGLVERGVQLTDDQVVELLFQPGFSTAEKVTNLSGRGVGMDVVRRNIEELRGSVAMTSAEGCGTRVVIRLPLTLAIIEGFLVRCGQTHFVLPLDLVRECVSLDAGEAHGLANGTTAWIDLRGEMLPVVDLQQAFSTGGVAQGRRSVVVVRDGTGAAGIVVDQLLGEFQTVIKPLGPLFRGLKGLSGSTILGTGEVALIIDVPALLALATQGVPAKESAGRGARETATIGVKPVHVH
jgi:two-component system chemotaxis sensor kinase CheA